MFMVEHVQKNWHQIEAEQRRWMDLLYGVEGTGVVIYPKSDVLTTKSQIDKMFTFTNPAANQPPPDLRLVRGKALENSFLGKLFQGQQLQ